MSNLVAAFLFNAFWQIPALATLAWLLVSSPLRLAAVDRHRIWALALVLSFLVPLSSIRHRPGGVESVTAPLEGKQTTRQTSSPVLNDATSVVGGVLPISVDVAIQDVLLALWMAFVMLSAIRLAHAVRAIAGIRADASSGGGLDATRSIERRCRKLLGVWKGEFLWTSRITGPITIGALHPAIVLPERLRMEGTNGGDDLWTTILGHELAHVGRNDFALNFLYRVVMVTIGFHPIAHLIQKQVDRTREQACDEIVTEKLMEPQAYARTLVVSATLFRNVHLGPSLGFLGGHPLKERIVLLRKRTERPVSRNPVFAAFFVAMLVVAAAFGSTWALTVSASPRETSLENRKPATLDGAVRVDGVPSDAPDSRTYRVSGRRDPFLGPNAKVHNPVKGPPGFEVGQLQLQGIVETPNGFTAMILGPDERAYFVFVGQRFSNGVLVAMDNASVTFEIRDASPLSALSSSNVEIRLHAE